MAGITANMLTAVRFDRFFAKNGAETALCANSKEN